MTNRQEDIRTLKEEYAKFSNAEHKQIGRCEKDPIKYKGTLPKFEHLIKKTKEVYPEAHSFSEAALLARTGDDYHYCEVCDKMLEMHKSLYKFSRFCSHACRSRGTTNPMAEPIIIDSIEYEDFPTAMVALNLSRIELRTKIFDSSDITSHWKNDHDRTCIKKLEATHPILTNKEYLLDWKESGRTIQELATEHEIDRSVASQAFLYHSIPTSFNQLPKEASEIILDESRFAEMFSGMSAETMAVRLGTTPGTILTYAKRYNLETNRGFQTSRGEIELFELIQGLKPDATQGTRGLLPNRNSEIDVYIPSMNLGFEFNGCFTHCIKRKPKNYHKDKTDNFRDIGIRLIHIWEDDWDQNRDVVKTFITNLLSKKDMIGARECEYRELTKDEYRIFMESNHMQGANDCSYKVGLVKNGIIVAAMGFKKIAANVEAIGNGTGYDLVRFANTNVTGAFTKLLKNFCDSNDVGYLVSFADLDIVDRDNNVYTKNGFEEVYKIDPDYRYYDPRTKKREHKFNYRKSFFESVGLTIDGKTEWELADEYKLLRCYDSGKIKYLKKIK